MPSCLVILNYIQKNKRALSSEAGVFCSCSDLLGQNILHMANDRSKRAENIHIYFSCFLTASPVRRGTKDGTAGTKFEELDLLIQKITFRIVPVSNKAMFNFRHTEELAPLQLTGHEKS